MAEADIVYRPDVSQKMTAALNNTYLDNNIAPGSFRQPDYWVYLYSISQKEFPRSLPPHLPRLTIKACPEGQRYVEVMKLAEPFEQADRDIDTGEVRMRFHNAKRIAQDIVCPEAANMDAPINPASTSSNTDLRQRGVFWSLHNPPLEAEVTAAYDRREKFYRGLLELATALEYTSPKELNERLNEDYHLAADYFGEEFSWHKARTRKVTKKTAECPFCGDTIKVGVAFHKGEDGDLCILDWKRAYEAGKVTLKQVPEDKRWLPTPA